MESELFGWYRAEAVAIIAEVTGLAFLLVGLVWCAIVARLPARTPFPNDTLNRPGNRHHRRVKVLDARLSLLAATLLVALLAVPLAWAWFPVLPFKLKWWAYWLILLPVLLAVGGWGWLGWKAWQARALARFAWHANLSVATQLARFSQVGLRCFHDVTIEGYLIDHVVVGAKGVFLVNVLPVPKPRKLKAGDGVNLVDRAIEMDGRRDIESVYQATRRVTTSTQALSKLVGHQLVLRSTIVVPGWNTARPVDGEHLLLNEASLQALPNWTEPRHHLLNDDIAPLTQHLTGLCRDPRPV